MEFLMSSLCWATNNADDASGMCDIWGIKKTNINDHLCFMIYGLAVHLVASITEYLTLTELFVIFMLRLRLKGKLGFYFIEGTFEGKFFYGVFTILWDRLSRFFQRERFFYGESFKNFMFKKKLLEIWSFEYKIYQKKIF